MSEFAEEMAEVAKELIDEEGRTIQILRFSEPTEEAWEESDPRANPSFDVTLIACFVEPLSLSRLGYTTVSPALVKNSEQIMLIGPGLNLVEALEESDEVIDGDTRWHVTGTDRLKPGDTTVLYFVGVNR